MNNGMGRPYLGSRPFDRHSQRFFCGREHEASLLAEWWQTDNLTFAAGPAGRGKTSLLLAGVLPLVADAPLIKTPHVLPVGTLSRGLAFPVTALPAHNPYTLSLLRSWAPGESPTRLAGLTIRDFVTDIGARGPILAAVDPTDELVMASGPRERHLRSFLAGLKDALRADSRLHLLVVGRDQTTAVIAKVLGSGRQYNVPPLSWQSAIDAVTGQFAAVGRRFADDAAEKFVTDVFTSRLVGENGAERTIEGTNTEPAIFQVACDQLWESLPADADPIMAQDIRRRVDVDAALAGRAAAVIAEVADEHGLSFKRLGDWLTESFITEMGTRNAQYEGVSTTARMPNVIVRTLEDRHLLVSSHQSGNRWYELISDRLIEPLRQLSRALSGRSVPWHPAADPHDLLSAAERALAVGDLALAKRHATAVLTAAESEQKPSSPRYLESGLAYSLLGNIAYEGGRSAEAEDEYREAVQYFTAATDTRAAGYQLAAIGQLLLEQERIAEATRALESAVRRVPNDATVLVTYATALWRLGEDFAAVAVLTEALGIDGENTVALRTRGEILAYLGEARAALNDLDRVSTVDRPATRAARGLALAELGDQRGACQEMEEAVALGERNGPVLLYAARAAMLIGDENGAEEYARQAAHATDPPLSTPQREMARKLVSQALATEHPG
jgi:tetratricopeptide (TPR) repeat protein